ncbi:MAG: PspC domain-containing protein [Anaerolineaceae bacterium]|jgi:phage shock protein C|nr:PspC domain-containing protein [Anaerolineaceae bacterium]
MTSEHRLYRSRSNRMVGGICAGLAEFLGIDPTIVRLLFVLGLFVIPGAIPVLLIVYFIMLLVVPEEPAAQTTVIPPAAAYTAPETPAQPEVVDVEPKDPAEN